MQFTLEQLARATDKYLEYRKEGYSHDGAIHQGALYYRDNGLSYAEATSLMRDAAQDA
ncbi:hypothetical protein ACUXAV_004894 [Cupriavidus metallidurans]|jgi:hypothetical protein|uniref:hypothetical protein n=1 Tax=Cupriavidus TaxID=106589 RepID=UPI0004B8CC18|nr:MULTISPECIES: hypothetical protein [Cupriavidus]MDE4922718.1 hypothetical protein [Cupriavidus metallidurans]